MNTELQVGGWLALCSEGENGLLPAGHVRLPVNDCAGRGGVLQKPPTPQICGVFCSGE